MGNCEGCKWAKAYPEFYVPEPATPNNTWTERWFGSEAESFDRLWWASENYKATEMVRCERYPRRENMHKTDTCGEFVASPAHDV